MIHPLIHLAASRPDLLAEHGEAYVALVGKELSDWKSAWVRRIITGAVAGVAALLALILISVALMLWAVTPDGDIRALWLLVAVPAFFLAVAIVAGLRAAKGGPQGEVFEDLKKQVRADLAMLREVNR